MPVDLNISLSTLYGFMLVLVRISGVFAFFPFPGGENGPSMARVVLSLACTMSLASRWPVIQDEVTPGLLLLWAISEAALGIMAGVAVSFITDSLTLGAQVLSLQAGYAYASTIDPSTQADSGILVILAQLLGGLLFFCFGLDRLVIHAMAASLETYPPGTFTLARPFAEEIVRLGAGMFTTAIRLALPVIALLAMIDIAIALLGRISPQMQVISVAFPVKMLVALLVLASVLVVAPSLYESYAHRVIGTVRTLILQR